MIWRALRAFAWTLAWAIALGCAAWAFGALRYDFPVGKPIVAWAFIAAIVVAIVFLHGAIKSSVPSSWPSPWC